jgi:predicted DsbA family dithiol-disulfide isomerase
VLVRVAEPHGFAASEVTALLSDPAELDLTRREAEGAVAGGVRGVPFFVFDGRIAVSGAQRETLLGEALRRARETHKAGPVLS